MSREILFRGKRLNNGGWETGSLIIIRWGCSDARHYITDKMTGYPIPIDPATVGQFTGICDKNGVKIFEGDVVASDAWCCKCHVVYMDGGFTLEEGETAENLGANFCDSYGYELDDVKVIGNIHDNPELAKEGQE